MLIELHGENFGCFRDEFRLSLLATDIDPENPRGVIEVPIQGEKEPLRLLRAIAIYGPNASGKSTIIRAAQVIRRLLDNTWRRASDEEIHEYQPFALSETGHVPVGLGLKAVIGGAVHDYHFSFDGNEFIKEELSRWNGNNQEVLFQRAGQDVVGMWTDAPQFELVSRKFRPNALLLSLADFVAPELAESVVPRLRGLLSFSGDSQATSQVTRPETVPEKIAERARRDSDFYDWLRDQIRAADVGVSELETIERQRWRLMRDETESDPAATKIEHYTSYMLSLLHHSDGPAIAIPYQSESLGTKRLIELSPMVHDLLHKDPPRAAFVDELDASIHPRLLEVLVRQVNDRPGMSHSGGQLIFTTHETSLLDHEAKDAVLRRDQIYFTEKDSTGAARLYSLAEFQERNNLNIRRRYLQGRYGALPSPSTFAD